MLQSDVQGIGLYLGFYAVMAGVPLILIRMLTNLPFELTRKLLHIVHILSFILLMNLFSSWLVAVAVAVLFALLFYPILAVLERFSLYQRIAVERKGGDFRRQLIFTQLTYALLIAVFWGVLGEEWRYAAVVAVMAWGFGDAAAALVGKAYGRRRIPGAGSKTVEGTTAMLVVAGLAALLTLRLYAGQPWSVSLIVALLVAPVCAAVELYSRGGMDTVTVPLVAGFEVLAIMALLPLESL